MSLGAYSALTGPGQREWPKVLHPSAAHLVQKEPHSPATELRLIDHIALTLMATGLFGFTVMQLLMIGEIREDAVTSAASPRTLLGKLWVGLVPKYLTRRGVLYQRIWVASILFMIAGVVLS